MDNSNSININRDSSEDTMVAALLGLKASTLNCKG